MYIEVHKSLEQLIETYNLEGELIDFTQCVTGLINDTYHVKLKNTIVDEYIFQRINDYVFKDPVKVMENINEVSIHVQSKKSKEDCGIISFLYNKENRNYTVCSSGYWRVCHYVDNSITFETLDDARILYSAGYAFGRFQHLLSDFPIYKLHETIPDFHNTKKRLDDLFKAVDLDPIGRVKEVSSELKFFRDNRKTASKLMDMQEDGRLPLRVTHNDTKYNNILMDKDTYKPLCVIDLDTVMPGLSAYDFGDAIRFAANTAIEDEVDLSKVGLDMEKYEEFTKGFIIASRELLSKEELNTMALGAITITIELASRFLADHINGDKYFRIHRENHNLDRARCQIKLAQDMIAKYDSMYNIVERYS